jgi:phosphopantothenoylcysteine decarboxylase / phosphopantothenate---cysteine ligase
MAGSRRILIGITGGIAAYKVPQLIRILKKRGAEVKVVITPNSLNLVGEEALRTVSGNPVYRDGAFYYDMDHIRLAEWADVFLICPATANTISKIACGIADNLLTTLALSIPEKKIMIAPAMNTTMWENSTILENLERIRKKQIRILPVGEGELACGTEGAGRMIDIEEIAEAALLFEVNEQYFRGKKILISCGPTEEAIDPVRVITNLSTGKMGAALAFRAIDMGADVTVVSGPVNERFPSAAQVISVRSAEQMRNSLLSHYDSSDICIMAAAVSDFRPVKYSEAKIPRDENGRLILELVSNPDILAELGKIKKDRFLVGFSLETGDNEDRARAKMEKKGCDLMAFNRAETSLGLSTTEITLLGKEGFREYIPVMDKSTSAKLILTNIARMMGLAHG